MCPQKNELSAGDSSVERAYAALRRIAVDYTVAPGSRLNEVDIAPGPWNEPRPDP